jgi:hypothetical protein
VLYKLLAGVPPFRGAAASVLGQVATSQPEPLSARRPDIPAELEAICLQMLAKSPEDRFPTLRGVADALGQFLQGHPNEDDREAAATAVLPAPAVSSRAVHVAPPVAERGRRRRWLQGLGTAGVLVSLLAGYLVFIQTRAGTLRVEINDPDVEVRVKGETIVLKRGERKEARLKPGDHALLVRRGNLEFETRAFEVKHGDIVAVSVAVLDGEVQVQQRGEVIGRVPITARAQAALPPPHDPAATSNFALRFNGGGEVVVESLHFDPAADYTLEGHFAEPVASAVSDRLGFGVEDQTQLSFTREGFWRWLYGPDDSKLDRRQRSIPRIASSAEWAHIARVRDSTTHRVYVNSRLQAAA